MRIRWTSARARHIARRSDRYPEAANIETAWADEAVGDPGRMGPNIDAGSHADTWRVVGYSPTAGFVVTVIALRIDGVLWGVTAWKTSGAERRR